MKEWKMGIGKGIRIRKEAMTVRNELHIRSGELVMLTNCSTSSGSASSVSSSLRLLSVASLRAEP